jgi:hypothetical protein
VTIAIRPFVGRDGGINKAVSTKAGSEIFLRTGLDTMVAEAPVGQISWVLVVPAIQLFSAVADLDNDIAELG